MVSGFPDSTGDSNLEPSHHVVWNDVEGELVLFDNRDGSYHALNGVGSHIWRNIAYGWRLSLIITDLCNEYHHDEAAIRADVEHFLSDVLAKGLLQSRGKP